MRYQSTFNVMYYLRCRMFIHAYIEQWWAKMFTNNKYNLIELYVYMHFFSLVLLTVFISNDIEFIGTVKSIFFILHINAAKSKIQTADELRGDRYAQ